MRRRFALTVAATTSLVLLAFLLPLGLLIRELAASRATQVAEQDARSLVQIVASVPDRTELRAAVERLDAGSPRAASVVLPDGTVLGAPVPRDAQLALAARGQAFTASGPGGRTVFVPVLLGDRGTAIVRVAVPDAELRRGVTRSIATLLGLGLLLLGVAVAVADRLARGVVRPVEEQAAVARRLAAGDLGARVEAGGPPEVVAVGVALNRLAGRIGDLLAAEREAVADLSHRLRTPLTVLRLDAESLHDRAEAARLGATVDAIERTVDEVIRTARTAAAGAVRRTDAVAVVRDRARFWRPLAEDQGRLMELTIGLERFEVAASRPDLEAALDALLSNVFAHTPDGAGLRLAVEPAGHGLRITVADGGPGLPPGALERGVSAAGSTGLGLDIAARTAEGAGGRLQHLPTDRGTALALDLPAPGNQRS